MEEKIVAISIKVKKLLKSQCPQNNPETNLPVSSAWSLWLSSTAFFWPTSADLVMPA